MEVEFDPKKAASNLRKHGIGFEEASSCLYDCFALGMEDSLAHEENRWVLTGVSDKLRHLTVVYTLRSGKIRIISARKATKREIRDYAKRV